MTSTTDWAPGDPVYPDQAPDTERQHCGPCQVTWTAPTTTCPECGQLSTEGLRSALQEHQDAVQRVRDAYGDGLVPGTHHGRMVNVRQVLDLLRPDGMWSYSEAGGPTG